MSNHFGNDPDDLKIVKGNFEDLDLPEKIAPTDKLLEDLAEIGMDRDIAGKDDSGDLIKLQGQRHQLG
ncbi:hypothetical protein PQX77_022288 [Marasmius sp. AFHP31]|nr:hypothetical protein PQX77_022288 [Marasmius sp. AFHP31]